MAPFTRRLGCSTISFRHQDLAEPLRRSPASDSPRSISAPCPACAITCRSCSTNAPSRTSRAQSSPRACGCARSTATSATSTSRSTTAPAPAARRHLDSLVALAVATDARALVLPCGAIDHTPVDTLDADIALVADELAAAADVAASRGVELWTESLHLHRLCWNLERAQLLTDRLADNVGIVMDFSHVVASGGDPVEFVDRFGPRIAHVHIRDAVPGNINLSVGNGHGRLRPRTQGTRRRRLRRPLLARTRNPRHHPRPTARGHRHEPANFISELI